MTTLQIIGALVLAAVVIYDLARTWKEAEH